MDLEYEKRYWKAYEDWRQKRLKSQVVTQNINKANKENTIYWVTDEDGRLMQDDMEAWQKFLEVARQAK